MGLDWGRLSLSGYLEALEAHNEAQGGEKPKAEASDKLMRFVKAHKRSDGGNRAGPGSVASRPSSGAP